jgi:hypothetical protein
MVTPVPKGRSRGRFATVLVVVVAGISAVALGLLALRSGDDSPGTLSPPVAVHDHEMGDALPGCDQQQMHASMMMFNPVVADELLTGTCPWPYDATIVVAGGAEDPSIAAPFEAHTYQEIFDLLTAEKFGTCNVSRLAEPMTNGFVFGFEVGTYPGGCAGGEASVHVTLREYASRAWRDVAAGDTIRSEGTPSTAVVLGRWVITLEGGDAPAIERLAGELVGMGATPI